MNTEFKIKFVHGYIRAHGNTYGKRASTRSPEKDQLIGGLRDIPYLWVTIRAELFTHLRVMLLFFSWAICMIAFFMWMNYAAMPNPKPALRFSFAETLETFRKDFGTSRDADLLPPVPLPLPPVKLPVSLPVFFPPDRLVANGPLPVSGLPSEPLRLAFAGK
jgi:hypothetical protein